MKTDCIVQLGPVSMRKIVGTRGQGLNFMILVNKLYTQTSDNKMITINITTH